MLDRKILLGTTMIAGVAALVAAVPSVSFAQTTPPAATAADDDDDDGTEVEALVVTGSRIKRTEFTSSAPIQVITAESSTLEGLVDTTEILQQSSLASGSFQVNNQLTGFVTTGGPGANTVSLRGLGATRTLVLLNGRRVGPAGTRGTVGPVDLNVIPQGIVERFEILKDGASSIYGSDAVAGVINIITKSNFDGIEASAYANQSFDGGGESYRINASWGKTFDRGFINASVDWYKQEVLRRGDREDTSCAKDLFNYPGGGGADYANTDPSQGADDTFKCYNMVQRTITTAAFGRLIYPDAGVTYPTVAQGNSGGYYLNTIGTTSPSGGTRPTYLQGGNLPVPFGLVRQARSGFPATFPYAHFDNADWQRASILSPVERTSLFVTGGFDITPTTELYGELLMNRRESVQYGVRQLFPAFSNANPNVPAGWNVGLQQTLASATATYQPIIPLPSNRDQTVDYWRGVVGLRGDFGALLEGWDWDIFYQYSKSSAKYGADIIYNDAVVATTGALACNPAALVAVSGRDCATMPGGIPWLSERILNGQFNDAERAFLFKHEYGQTDYTQSTVEGSVSGDLFSLPAGPVGAAFGFSWRRDEIDDKPGQNERGCLSSTPASVLCGGGNLWGSTSAGRTAGSDTVQEFFGELEVPVIKGLPGIESLDLQISGRYTDYASYGSDSTHKYGLNWQITPSWRIRATDGTSFRAPALYELYLANQTGFLGQTSVDPCILYETSANPYIPINCAAAGVPLNYTGAGTSSATIITGGGAGVLKAETSNAKTLGVIWTPEFLDVSVAVDYFEIQLNNEIRQFGAANIAFQCYSSPNPATSPYCTLLNGGVAPYRNTPLTPGPNSGPNAIQTIQNSYVNVAEQINRGMDLTIRYRHEFDFGRLTVDGQFTWQFQDDVQLLGSSAIEDYNGSTFLYDGPDFSGQINTRFDRGDWTFNWSIDMLGKGSDTEVFKGDTFRSATYLTQCRRTTDNVTGLCTALLGSGPLSITDGTSIYNAGTSLSPFVYYKQYTEFYVTHDLSVRRKFNDWTFSAGVQNVFDERPPSQSAGQFRVGTAALNGYDVIGRRAFFLVSKKW